MPRKQRDRFAPTTRIQEQRNLGYYQDLANALARANLR